MPKLYEITDAYSGGDLPVEETVLPTDRPRVIINTAEFDKPKEPTLWDNVGMAGVENKDTALSNLKSKASSIADAIKYASELDQKFTSSVLNFPKKAYENSDDLVKGLKNLFGLGEEERYQLWPEKVVREALTSAGDIAKPNPYPEGSEQYYEYEGRRQGGMVPAAMAISALAGSGGLGGTGAKAGEVALGATPFLRPALKHKEKLYKGKPGQEHQDIIPKELYEDFRHKAMSGEDLAEYNFGFINDKGHFLDREKALKYGIDTGLIDPHSGRFGALTTTLMADSSKPGTAIEAMAKTNPFYSAVEHTVKNIPQGKMTGEQWLGTIANKPGVKGEELDWTGLKGFLEENKGKPVTKAQIEKHLAANKVELKEVTKGGEATKEQAFALAKEHGWKSWGDIDPATQAKYMERASREAGSNPTKYSNYQLPGGENYREKLLTLPKENNLAKLENEYKTILDKWKKTKNLSPEEQARWDVVEAEIGAARNRGENIYDGNFQSSHWDEPNIIAHVRMNDRTIDGKKSLHLEEIQSDWHQAGREKGYANNQKPYEVFDPVTADIKGRYATEAEAKAAATKGLDYSKSEGVPDAPFKKNWSELALKKMIREASENGYDRLSWTAGEHHPTNPKNLKQTGPEADKADKGMQGFYNDIIPKVVEKLGKEHGVKVKTSEVETNPKGWHLTIPEHTVSGKWMVKSNDYNSKGMMFETKAEAEAVLAKKLKDENGGKKIYYIDIPQSLKDTALNKGFPLFSASPGYMFVPFEGDPFKDLK